MSSSGIFWHSGDSKGDCQQGWEGAHQARQGMSSSKTLNTNPKQSWA